MKDVDKGQNNLFPSKGLLDDLNVSPLTKIVYPTPQIILQWFSIQHIKVKKQIQRVLLIMQMVFTRPDFAVETVSKCFSVETVTKCLHIAI